MSVESPNPAFEAPKPARRAFVVVGMHRSGTSAMTRTLSLLGATLPQKLMPAVEDNNAAGFWEAQAVADLNDEILQAQDSEWDDVFSFRPRQYLSNFDRFYAGRAAELLEQEFNGSEVIVLKDPRISVLTKFWDRALLQAGYSSHYVIMVRNPLEVAESLRERDAFPREKSLLLWCGYMIAAERDTRGRERLFVSYDQLVDDWRSIRKRMEESAGMPFPRDTPAAANEIDRYLNRSLRHHSLAAADLSARLDVPEEVKTLYRIFTDACRDGEIDRAAVEAVEAELSKMDTLLGPLVADFRGRVRSLKSELAELGHARLQLEQTHIADQEQADARERDLAAEKKLRGQEAARAADLAADLAAAHAETDRLSRNFANEASRAQSEIADLVSRLAAEETEKNALQDQIEQSRRDQRVAELALEAERAAAAADLDRLNGELHARLEEEAKLTALLKQSRFEHDATSSRLDERFREIATLTSMLAEREAAERKSREQGDWLREATSIIVASDGDRHGRWLKLLPAFFLIKRRYRLLRRRGIFDGRAYLEAHSDVAANGVDPLQHYLLHGLPENRRRR